MGMDLSLKANHLVKDGEIIDVLGTKVKCIHVPGHTKGGVCYYFADYGWLISGDTLFQMSIGRTDFPTGNLNDLLTAIREKLFVLPPWTKVLSCLLYTSASQYVNIPVINAGDGGHNHPTQTLTDLLTIRREKGRLSNFTIGFCGDLKFGRTVHSLIKALSRYEGINYILISPEELQIPEYLKKDVFEKKGITFTEVDKMEDVMPQLDILYMTRVQRERFFNEADYVRLRCV